MNRNQRGLCLRYSRLDRERLCCGLSRFSHTLVLLPALPLSRGVSAIAADRTERLLQIVSVLIRDFS